MYSCKYTWIVKALINIITRINVSIYKINTHIFVCIHEQISFRIIVSILNYKYSYNYTYHMVGMIV